MARFSLKRWWRHVRPGPWKVVAEVSEADQVPMVLPAQQAAMVVSGGKPKWIVFDCACGRGHRIMLNLDHSRLPKWRVITGEPLTIAPSVDVQHAGHRCHYLIRDGHAHWVPEVYSGRSRSRETGWRR